MEVFMAVTEEGEEKKERVIGVRVTQEQYCEIQRVIREKYITKSRLGRILFELFLRQEVSI
jgi:hypothetical protein